MSKLDEIKPTHYTGLYKVEIQVEGEWVAVALLSKQSIITLSENMDEYCDEDAV